jgi:hypothetical protein
MAQKEQALPVSYHGSHWNTFLYAVKNQTPQSGSNGKDPRRERSQGKDPWQRTSPKPTRYKHCKKDQVHKAVIQKQKTISNEVHLLTAAMATQAQMRRQDQQDHQVQLLTVAMAPKCKLKQGWQDHQVQFDTDCIGLNPKPLDHVAQQVKKPRQERIVCKSMRVVQCHKALDKVWKRQTNLVNEDTS